MYKILAQSTCVGKGVMGVIPHSTAMRRTEITETGELEGQIGIITINQTTEMMERTARTITLLVEVANKRRKGNNYPIYKL